MLKKLYNLAAVGAIVHLLVLLGLTGYLFANGTLDAERIEALVAVLRADDTGDGDDAAETEEEEATVTTSEESIAQEQLHEEMQRRAIRRGLSELRHKRVAVSLVMQRALADKERFEKENALRETEARQRQVQEQEEGFKKTLEYIESVKPANAKDLLLLGSSEEEAARILLALDTRKGKKIIEAAFKDPTTRPRMQKVFKMVRDLAPTDSEWADMQPPQEGK